ncbi:10346_t:CDS:1 [Cetraspora pellucida]|uniref:10346_t:CDS:1 n=1 Tax=Cetraspora pellucida TaxID=1433469 RepID=A0ACA9K9X0_9GLOM|nr:10346_t:CDS:1 [Cetraspora pellucida]
MSSHATVIIVIVTKDDFNSLTQSFTKYQMSENDFKIIHWKYFYPFNQPYTEFSVGDVVMFAGKFVVENLEQHIAVSCACVIVSNDPDHEFQAEEIPLSIPHSMFLVLVTREPKEHGESTYFDAGCCLYNPCMNSKNVHMKLRIFYPTNTSRYSYLRANNSIKTGRTFVVSGFIRRMTSDFTIVELTDLDFVSNSVIKNVQTSFSSVASDNRSDIDLITEDIELTTSRAPKRPRILASRSSKQGASSSPIIDESAASFSSSAAPINTIPKTVQNQKDKKKLSDLALNCLEQPVMNDTHDDDVYAEDVSEGDDDLELLREQDLEVQQNKRNKKSSKRVKK